MLGAWVHAVVEEKVESVRGSLGLVVSLVERGDMRLTQLRSWEQRECRCCRSQCAVVVGRRQDRVRREGLGLGKRI